MFFKNFAISAPDTLIFLLFSFLDFKKFLMKATSSHLRSLIIDFRQWLLY